MQTTAKALHRATAFLVLTFLILHVITHLAGLWGINAYITVQSLFRTVYQNPLVEPILLVSLLVQLLSGALLLIRKTRRGLRSVWDKTQVFSGAIILFFAIQHVPAYMLARWSSGLDTTFYWPASVMNGAPFVYYFAPYYFFGVCALFLHVAAAARLLLLRGQHKTTAPRVFWSITATGISMATLIVLMLGGAFYDITLPPEWIGYLQSYIPTYGS